MNAIDPPAGFNASFFDWLEIMSDELWVVFIDRGGLSHSEIDVLEQENRGNLPAQIRIYYENCNPWATWKSPFSVWKRIQEDTVIPKQIHGPVAPININSLQGNYTIARILSQNDYEIIDLKHDGTIKVHNGDLRSYFVEVVQEEIRRSAQ